MGLAPQGAHTVHLSTYHIFQLKDCTAICQWQYKLFTLSSIVDCINYTSYQPVCPSVTSITNMLPSIIGLNYLYCHLSLEVT
jgi:hypothetical protein